ncbi:hypothetical protein EHQ53_02170 [Leptospira langatensis]|uniref:Peptidylprolyl isomerase n=1 Tax=Leptospira langatensis TaxID=2484983 RepID=A0A5F1ZZH7_9LEPT|nr:hypothetical protein [Leptospira langatensis]TGJ98549.1 hypothetical protein EHO57_18310 [Leptospira langatensis]TGL43463.1 hypothetical protein EHQ53_02170 [Leptospira langatensis]
MNKKILVLSLLSFALTQCSMDSDVLASFKGGTVTRKELRNFFKLNTGGRKQESGHPTLEEQNQLLETLGLFKLINVYNTDNKLVSDQELGVFLKYSKPQMAASFLQKNLAEKLEREGQLKFAFARVILVSSPDPKDEAASLQRAETILANVQKLSSKKEIAKFVTENTDETSRRAVGGLLEPQCLNCGTDPNSAITQEAADKKGTWILRELQDPTPNADPKTPRAKKFLVLRVEQVETIYAARLTKFFAKELGKLKAIATDYTNTPGLSEQAKADAKRYYADLKVDDIAPRYEDYMKKRFLYNAVSEAEADIIKNSGYERALVTQENLGTFTPESILLTNPKTGETVKFKDVVAELKQLAALSGLDASKLDDKASVLQFFKQQYIWFKIADHSPELKKALASKEFEEEFELMKLYIVQPLVFKKVLPNDVSVTEDEMKAQYEAAKMFSYAKPNPANPQDRIPLPYGEVRERIKDDLIRTKKQSLVRDFTMKLKSDYQFILDSERLKPGKI